MPRVSAARVRWVLLVAGLACWLAGILWIFNVCWPQWELLPNDPKTGAGLIGVLGFWWREQWAYLLSAAGYLGIFLISQWFFLGPRGSYRLQLNQVGRPLRLSMIIAALMAALLSVGLLATIAELGGVWQTVSLVDAQAEHPRYWPALLALGLAWGLWALVFFVYWRRGDRSTQLARMLRGLMAGSILELLVAAPVHVLILRSKEKQSCYCEIGSYTTLVLGSTVLLWTFGPGIILLFLREKARRQPLLSREDESRRPPGAV